MANVKEHFGTNGQILLTLRVFVPGVVTSRVR